MSLGQVVSLSIAQILAGANQANFGTPLFMAYHTGPSLIKSYSSTDDVAADFALTSPAYRAALKVFGQNPAPANMMIGRRAIGTTQIVTLTAAVTTAGYKYILSVFDYLGIEHAVSYAVPGTGSPTSTTIGAAIVTAIGSVAHATVASSGAVITITSTTAGDLFNITTSADPTALLIANTSTDPGIATDLDAVYRQDSASWYGIILDSNGTAEIKAAAAWVQATRKILLVNTSDSAVQDPAITSDVISYCDSHSYGRTGILFSASELLSYSGAAWEGNRFPFNPGKATYSYCTLIGVTFDVLNDAQLQAVWDKGGNTYTKLAGLGWTFKGQMVDGTRIDLVTGTDWFFATLQRRIYEAFQAASKAGSRVPMTDDGISTIVACIWSVIQLAQSGDYNLLAKAPAPTVTAPKASAVALSDRAARTLKGVSFTAQYAGGIEKAVLSGVITV